MWEIKIDWVDCPFIGLQYRDEGQFCQKQWLTNGMCNEESCPLKIEKGEEKY